MDLHEAISKAKKISSQNIDWNDNLYNPQKSKVSALYSFISYDYLSENEVNNHERIKFFPCSHYKTRLLSEKKSVGWSIQLAELFNEENTVIVETTDMVVIIYRTTDAIFVAFRGTKGYFDIKTDLKCSLTHIHPSKHDLRKLHYGFYSAVKYAEPFIYEGVKKLKGHSECQVYFTGHSLGGAMASIAYNTFNLYGFKRFHGLERFQRSKFDARINSCYTFGSPRYGNDHCLLHSLLPYHIFNDGDFIPSIPPTFFGYKDNHNDYCLSEAGEYKHPVPKGNVGLRLFQRKFELLSLKNHSMEVYLKRILMK